MKSRFLGFASLVFALAAPQLVAADAPPVLASAKESAARLVARDDLADYRGWLKYLAFLADSVAARDGAASETAAAAVRRLEEWTQRIAADPQTLAKLRGVQEWAYESPVDGSGQPFKIMIPTDYDPARPAPLSVYMHGYTGDHLKHSTGMAEHTGTFELSVLGRARGGWYVGLSQADVLHAIDYVEAHWAIDRARIGLSGGSMGGGATFKLGARFPHRFASGQITCGYVLQEPIGNLLTFPIYATHSDDDPTVPILTSRGPLQELRRMGGQAIFDQATGYGHAVWDYAEGGRRSAGWVVHQALPASRDVRHIDFTALDGGAVRGWWAEIAEWGPEAKPARFVLTAGNNNTLFAELTNVARLRIDLAAAPFDRSRPLAIVKAGAVPITVPAPLPDSVEISASAPAADATAPTFRLHTPGGTIQLYDGSPLLIVYGTGGGEAARAAMRAAAAAASKSPNPSWAGDDGDRDPADVDGVPHHRNLFGNLVVKADTDVTAADLARCHLVLIGSADENSVVAQMAGRLPVRFADGRIVCSDGVVFPAAERTLGLLHFNPLAPQRFVFWVASADPAGYAAGATVAELGSQLFIGADLLVTHATRGALVATRSFDSRWRWIAGRENSPALSSLHTQGELAHAIAACVRRATGADFAVAGAMPALGAAPVTDGTTRVADLAALFFGQTVDTIEITGAELLKANEVLAKLAPDAAGWVAFEPAVPVAAIDAARRYRVALPTGFMFPFGRAVRVNVSGQSRSDVMVADALERFLARP